jgi:uncharacterized protein (DUF1330 family)
MSACVIGHITVKDEEKWAQYRAQVPATLAPWGAELLFRGQRADILAGNHAHLDTVVIRFPDADSVDAWYNSPEYQALIPLRQQAADLDLVVFSD